MFYLHEFLWFSIWFWYLCPFLKYFGSFFIFSKFDHCTKIWRIFDFGVLNTLYLQCFSSYWAHIWGIGVFFNLLKKEADGPKDQRESFGVQSNWKWGRESLEDEEWSEARGIGLVGRDSYQKQEGVPGGWREGWWGGEWSKVEMGSEGVQSGRGCNDLKSIKDDWKTRKI